MIDLFSQRLSHYITTISFFVITSGIMTFRRSLSVDWLIQMGSLERYGSYVNLIAIAQRDFFWSCGVIYLLRCALFKLYTLQIILFPMGNEQSAPTYEFKNYLFLTHEIDFA